MSDYILEMDNITKSFPGVKALDNVKLKVKKGTVHALLGENGAGKSTFMKILNGMYKPDEGTIIFDGIKRDFQSPSESLKAGISMIHQELNPIPYMTIAENIYLGREPMHSGFLVNQKELNNITRTLFKELDIELDPASRMKDLSIANIQLVEIAKAISHNSKLIAMDEPTSAIADKEVQFLFKTIRTLTAKGVSIIYISHKLDEIHEITDEVTFLRDGTYIDTVITTELSYDKMISLMVGRDLSDVFPKQFAPITDVVLEVKNFSLKGSFENVSFNLRKGEILGIAGLIGAGRTELVESLFGYHPPDKGEVFINGEKVDIKSPIDAKRLKIGLITEDRKLTGLYLVHSVMDNMMIANIKKYLNGPFFLKKKATIDCQQQKESLSIKTPNLKQLVKNLSGGNQQKILLARWLLTDPDILILDEPTRGIDVGAKSEIHTLMCELAKKGKAIIMISSEMPEVLGMSDRVIIMHSGVMTGELDRKDFDQDKIMKYATGMTV